MIEWLWTWQELWLALFFLWLVTSGIQHFLNWLQRVLRR